MEWHLSRGVHSEFLEGLQEDGIEVPSLEDRPVLWPWLTSVYQAFWRLSASRQHAAGGMSRPFPQPISIEAVVAYASRLGPIHQDDFEVFLDRIIALDGAYLKYRQDQTPKDTPPPVGKR